MFRKCRVVGYLLSILFFPITANSTDFILESELRTNFGGQGQTKQFFSYSYDSKGDRIARRIYTGADSTTPLMSTVSYEWDNNGILLRKDLSDGSSIVTSVVYHYDSNEQLIAIVTNDEEGSVMFVDSISYNANGISYNVSRYVDESRSFFRKYTLDDNWMTSDTLYEKDDEGFTPSQVTIYERDKKGRITSELHKRKISDRWSVTETIIFVYDNTLLMSVTSRSGNSESGIFNDSIAYKYDEHGNRIREEGFTSDRDLLYTIDFTWKIRPVYVTSINRVKSKSLSNRYVKSGNSIVITGLLSGKSASIRIVDLNGRTIVHKTVKTFEKTIIPVSIKTTGKVFAVAIKCANAYYHFTFTTN